MINHPISAWSGNSITFFDYIEIVCTLLDYSHTIQIEVGFTIGGFEIERFTKQIVRTM
jgi:hypothetical protein